MHIFSFQNILHLFLFFRLVRNLHFFSPSLILSGIFIILFCLIECGYGVAFFFYPLFFRFYLLCFTLLKLNLYGFFGKDFFFYGIYMNIFYIRQKCQCCILPSYFSPSGLLFLLSHFYPYILKNIAQKCALEKKILSFR